MKPLSCQRRAEEGLASKGREFSWHSQDHKSSLSLDSSSVFGLSQEFSVVTVRNGAKSWLEMETPNDFGLFQVIMTFWGFLQPYLKPHTWYHEEHYRNLWEWQVGKTLCTSPFLSICYFEERKKEKKSKKICFAQGIFHPKMLSKFLTEPSNILRAIRSSPTRCGCYLHQKPGSTQKGKQHLYKCFSFFWGWGRGLDRDTTVVLHVVKKPSQWIIVSAFLLFPPSIIFSQSTEDFWFSFGPWAVPDAAGLHSPFAVSKQCGLTLICFCTLPRKKKNQAGWPAKVTL